MGVGVRLVRRDHPSQRVQRRLRLAEIQTKQACHVPGAEMFRVSLHDLRQQIERTPLVPLLLPVERRDGEIDFGVGPAGPLLDQPGENVARAGVVKVAHQRDASIVELDLLPGKFRGPATAGQREDDRRDEDAPRCRALKEYRPSPAHLALLIE